MSDFASATKFYQLAISSKTNSANAHFLLGNLYYKNSRYLEAQRQFKNALGFGEAKAGILLNLGLTKLVLKGMIRYFSAYRKQRSCECFYKST